MVFSSAVIIILGVLSFIQCSVSVISPITDQLIPTDHDFNLTIHPTMFQSDTDEAISVFVEGEPDWINVEQEGIAVKGFVTTSGATRQLVAVGDFVYSADMSAKFEIFDISDLENPVLHKVYDGGMSDPRNVDMSPDGTIAYVGSDTEGINIINCTDKLNPSTLGFIPGFHPQGVVGPENNIFYMTNYDQTPNFMIYNVTIKTNPEELFSIKLSGNVATSSFSLNYFYIVRYTDGMDIWNVSYPDSPSLVHTYDVGGNSAQHVVCRDDICFLGLYTTGWRILNVSIKTSPQVLYDHTFPVAGEVRGVAVSGDYLLISNWHDGNGGLHLWNISDLTNPYEIDFYQDTDHNRYFTGGFVNQNTIIGGNRAAVDSIDVFTFGTLFLNGTSDSVASETSVQVKGWDGSEEGVDEFTITVGEVFICNGKESTEPDVCSGHGDCVSENICACTSLYWKGEDCSEYTAFAYIGGEFVEWNYDMTNYTFGCDENEGSSSNIIQPIPRKEGCMFHFRNGMNVLFGGNDRRKKIYMNDLWTLSYDPINKNEPRWCFLSGNNHSEFWNEEEKKNNTENTYSQINQFSSDNQIGSRSSFGSFTTEFSLFVFGGEKYIGNETNEFWEFSIIHPNNRNQWRILKEHLEDPNDISEVLPSPRSSLCSAMVTRNSFERVYFFGGKRVNDDDDSDTIEIMFNDLWSYEIQTNEFSRLREGRNDEFSNSFSFSEFQKNEYNSSIDPPHRFSHICWSDPSTDNFFIFGGSFYDEMIYGNDVWMYNTTESSWIFIHGGDNQSVSSSLYFDDQNLPSSRYGMIFFSRSIQFFNDDHFVTFFGGFGKDPDGRKAILGDMWSYSYVLNQFRFVNGSTEVNLESDKTTLGSKALGMGFATENKVLVMWGGDSIASL